MGDLTREELMGMGFIELDHFTIQNSLVYDIGRNRQLSIGSLGTFNEMMFLVEMNNEQKDVCDAVIVIHNYDFDGPLTKKKVRALIEALDSNRKNEPDWINAVVEDGRKYEEHYLCEPVDGLPDCGSCPELNITQHSQEALRRKNIPLREIPRHRCNRYRERLFHYRSSSMIKPCEQCLKENFNKEEAQ